MKEARPLSLEGQLEVMAGSLSEAFARAKIAEAEVARMKGENEQLAVRNVELQLELAEVKAGLDSCQKELASYGPIIQG